MSRQMACQLSGAQIIEWTQKLIDLSAGREEKYPTFGELLDAIAADPKDRLRMETAFGVLSELSKEGLSGHDVMKVIRWRNEKGEPGPMEIHFSKSGMEKRARQITQRSGSLESLALLGRLLR